MAIPVLQLNLVPAPTIWRQRHETLGWFGLAFGLVVLASSLTTWGVQATRTKKMVNESVKLSNRAKNAAQKEFSLRQELATLDITREMPRWRLAERIYLERGLPWSRITAELERCLVDGVRTKALSRNRGADGTVELKLRGESRRREDEVEFIENLQKNGLFVQVVLEREAERQGGGIDFELRLPLIATPPPYDPLPTPEERKKALQAKQGNSKNPQPLPVTEPKPAPKTTPPQVNRIVPPQPAAPHEDKEPDGRPIGAGRPQAKPREMEEFQLRRPVRPGNGPGPMGDPGPGNVPGSRRAPRHSDGSNE